MKQNRRKPEVKIHPQLARWREQHDHAICYLFEELEVGVPDLARAYRTDPTNILVALRRERRRRDRAPLTS
jgi:hypothetical protein